MRNQSDSIRAGMRLGIGACLLLSGLGIWISCTNQSNVRVPDPEPLDEALSPGRALFSLIVGSDRSVLINGAQGSDEATLTATASSDAVIQWCVAVDGFEANELPVIISLDDADVGTVSTNPNEPDSLCRTCTTRGTSCSLRLKLQGDPGFLDSNPVARVTAYASDRACDPCRIDQERFVRDPSSFLVFCDDQGKPLSPEVDAEGRRAINSKDNEAEAPAVCSSSRSVNVVLRRPDAPLTVTVSPTGNTGIAIAPYNAQEAVLNPDRFRIQLMATISGGRPRIPCPPGVDPDCSPLVPCLGQSAGCDVADPPDLCPGNNREVYCGKWSISGGDKLNSSDRLDVDDCSDPVNGMVICKAVYTAPPDAIGNVVISFSVSDLAGNNSTATTPIEVRSEQTLSASAVFTRPFLPTDAESDLTIIVNGGTPPFCVCVGAESVLDEGLDSLGPAGTFDPPSSEFICPASGSACGPVNGLTDCVRICPETRPVQVKRRYNAPSESTTNFIPIAVSDGVEAVGSANSSIRVSNITEGLAFSELKVQDPTLCTGSTTTVTGSLSGVPPYEISCRRFSADSPSSPNLCASLDSSPFSFTYTATADEVQTIEIAVKDNSDARATAYLTVLGINPACNDFNDCTTDGCTGSACTYSNNTAACSDGITCNGTDACQDGACASHTGDPCFSSGRVCVEGFGCLACSIDSDCNDNNPCTTDDCFAGACQYANNSNSCDDNLYCNGDDTCSGGVCTHTGDPCIGSGQICIESSESCVGCTVDPQCNDFNDCTDDVCNAGGCEWTNRPNGDDCTDGIFCNGVDTCQGGVCNHPGDPCVGNGKICIESSGSCVGCTVDPQCNDFNDCTDDVCNAGTCVWTNRPNGDACDDGLFCNGDDDTCLAGACSGHGIPPCEVGEICDEAFNVCTGCEVDGDCDDDNSCTTHICVPHPIQKNRNVCQLGPIQPGTCQDNLYCNGTDTCSNGECVHTGNPCASDERQCIEESDQCIPCTEDIHCQDELHCNGEEWCDSGDCEDGTPPLCTGTTPFCVEVDEVVEGQPPYACVGCNLNDDQCDDGKYCNGQEVCEATGACVSPSIPCCSVEYCDEAADVCECDSSSDCDDGNICTNPSCEGGVCVFLAAGGNGCNDGLACNGLETCDAQGSCQPDTSFPCSPGQGCQEPGGVATCITCLVDADCNDGNPCTTDNCVGPVGSTVCNNPPDNTATCDDGIFCNGTESCAGGVCEHSGNPCVAPDVCDAVCQECK